MRERKMRILRLRVEKKLPTVSQEGALNGSLEPKVVSRKCGEVASCHCPPQDSFLQVKIYDSDIVIVF